jgi:hypothetical protein
MNAPSHLPMGIRDWSSANIQFVLHCNQIAGFDGLEIRMTFEADKIAFQINGPTGYFDDQIQGHMKATKC